MNRSGKVMALLEGRLKSSSQINVSRLLKAAQEVYDEWEQDEEGIDPMLGTGGICQDIAGAIASELDDQGIEAYPVSASVGEQHVYVAARLEDGVHEVDIPPHVYETGSGYRWKKRKNIKFKKSDLVVSMLDPDPDSLDAYLD